MAFKPEFFDLFGIIVFAYIIALTLWALINRRPIPWWALIILCIIGFAGLAVDGAIVYMFYVR